MPCHPRRKCRRHSINKAPPLSASGNIKWNKTGHSKLARIKIIDIQKFITVRDGKNECHLLCLGFVRLFQAPFGLFCYFTWYTRYVVLIFSHRQFVQIKSVVVAKNLLHAYVHVVSNYTRSTYYRFTTGLLQIYYKLTYKAYYSLLHILSLGGFKNFNYNLKKFRLF